MDSPRQLRNRQTPSKVANSSYEEISSTPIGRKSMVAIAIETVKETATRKSTRNLQVQLAEKRLANGRVDCDSESVGSDGSNNSNAENELKKSINQLKNEKTPNVTTKLSRKRTTKPSFVSESNIDEKEKKVKCTIRRQEASTSANVTPLSRSKRKSVKPVKYDVSSSDDDEESPPKRRNASYFRKEDFEDYKPDNYVEEDLLEESLDENSSEGEDEDEEEPENEGSDGETKTEYATPKKISQIRNDMGKLNVTPELLNRLEGRSIRMRLGVNSPVATSSQTMSPNPETYFLAENRLKFKATKKDDGVTMNDAMKGKRKGKRIPKSTLEDRLPDRISSDFSVTAEAQKATVSKPEEFIAGNHHEDRVDELLKNVVENEFPHWLGLFGDGFNVMLYGYGSKLSIFKEFESFVNEKYFVVSVNGLFPKLNPRKLLNGICTNVSPPVSIPHGVNLEAVAREAVKDLNQLSHSDIFILVNNFDNLALRFPQVLTVLCWLSQVSYIHILASCDTANAFLGVTQSQALQLNFCWMHCPTYQQYRQELKWIPGIYGDETKVVTQKSSLKYVLQSLTGNARKAFALLAQIQLKQMKSRSVQKAKEAYTGVRFQELAKECREKFIAHSDENLRTLLVEFFDHKLIKQTGKAKHLENTLLIELDIETLEEVMSELN